MGKGVSEVTGKQRPHVRRQMRCTSVFVQPCVNCNRLHGWEAFVFMSKQPRREVAGTAKVRMTGHSRAHSLRPTHAGCLHSTGHCRNICTLHPTSRSPSPVMSTSLENCRSVCASSAQSRESTQLVGASGSTPWPFTTVFGPTGTRGGAAE
jgi:hypothetical protein